MREDLRALQGIVYEYMRANKLNGEEFAKLGGENLNRGKLQYLLNGKASTMDVELFSTFAKALGLSFNTLAARCGLLGATENARADLLIGKAQTLAAELEGVQRDIFLDKLEDLVELTIKSTRS